MWTQAVLENSPAAPLETRPSLPHNAHNHWAVLLLDIYARQLERHAPEIQKESRKTFNAINLLKNRYDLENR